MLNDEIAQMSEIDFEAPIKELEEVYEKLKILEETCDEIKRASQLFDGKITSDDMERKRENKNIFTKKRDRTHQELMNRFHHGKMQRRETKDMEFNFNEESGEEDGLKILNNDSDICRTYLLELFRDNDLEDLKYSFLEGDNFNINITAKNSPILPSINGDTSSTSDVYSQHTDSYVSSTISEMRPRNHRKDPSKPAAQSKSLFSWTPGKNRKKTRLNNDH